MNLAIIDDGKRFDVGVLVGRFQVPDLHEGHRQIIQIVRERHKHTLILIGVAPTLGTKENPLPYVLRMQMLQALFPDVIILPMLDTASDHEWSRQLDLLVRTTFPTGSVRLYGGRDSFIQRYHGAFPTFEYPCVTHPDGTAMRDETGHQYINDPLFRRGVIWASQNQYPKVWPTVDVAMVNRAEGTVLMGKRPGKETWRFPGGFVDPTDLNLEDAAKREIYEETGLVCEGGVRYLGSIRVNDWRYNTPDQRVTTAFFVTEYTWGDVKRNEEFAALEFIPLDTLIDQIEESHQPLFELLKRRVRITAVATEPDPEFVDDPMEETPRRKQ